MFAQMRRVERAHISKADLDTGQCRGSYYHKQGNTPPSCLPPDIAEASLGLITDPAGWTVKACENLFGVKNEN